MEDYNPDNSVENSIYNQGVQQGAPSMQQPQQAAPRGQDAEIQQVASMITDLDRRLRILEERYGNIRKKLQLTDQNILESERGFVKELRSINDDTMRLKKAVNDYTEKITIFTDEIGQAAKKTDIKLIEKYLDLWDPKNFVTRKEVKEYLKRKEEMEREADEERDDSEEKQEFDNSSTIQ